MNSLVSLVGRAAALVVWLVPAVATGQVEKGKATGPAPSREIRELAVSPAEAPVPAFKYLLKPSSARLAPGDGAPILLRLRYDVSDADWAEIEDSTAGWIHAAIGRPMPPEASAMVEKRRGSLDLLAVGVRRERCDWAYPIREQGVDVVDLLMPDVGVMRNWGRLQAVATRILIDRGDFTGAARSLTTGFALAERVAEGPFLINGLVGVAIADVQLATVEAWIAAPGSPNLYWALTELGEPLVSLDRAVEQERLFIERSIPELADESEPTTAEGWSARLAAIDRRVRGLAARIFSDDDAKPSERDARVKAALGADLAEYKRMHMDEFRRLLVAAGDFSAERVRAMSDDEAAVRGAVLAYRVVWEGSFRDWRLEFPAFEAREAQRQAEGIEAERGPAGLAALFASSLASCRVATARLDRRVAMLRAVEAIRMRAAAREGRLPRALGDVREAPVPADPMTGEPFGWTMDGEVATLSPPEPRRFAPDYRITIRKP